jgi:hypothetical protein
MGVILMTWAGKCNQKGRLFFAAAAARSRVRQERGSATASDRAGLGRRPCYNQQGMACRSHSGQLARQDVAGRPAGGQGRALDMNTPLLTVRLRRNRDLLLVRQRARQIARILGFDAAEQSRIAAAVFHLAWHAVRHVRRPDLVFRIADAVLHVAPQCPRGGDPAGARETPDGCLRLERPLPQTAEALDAADVAWALRELMRLAPPSVFEEVQQQNQDLLQAYHELQACRTELDHRKRSRPDAA